MKALTIIFLIAIGGGAVAQERDNTLKKSNEAIDSLFIKEVETKQQSVKILHAEPLYIDLIRDLGARKGEKEWNIGLGLTDNNKFDRYDALVEYEWAPVNRLGVEVELPFTIYYPTIKEQKAPGTKLNSIKLATQYSFFVSEKLKTTMAIGYIQEFELAEFRDYTKKRPLTGNIYNPFLVVAKRFGYNFHSLIYSGPKITHHFSEKSLHTNWQINSNFHYMIPGTRNFVGIEFNKEIGKTDFDMTIRPQMRVGVTDNLIIGIVTGIPVDRERERFSSFLRLIYEPRHKR